MSQKEIKRIEVLEPLVNGMMSNRDAAESLHLCRRQIVRLRKKYTAQGETGLIYGYRGRHPLRALPGFILIRAPEALGPAIGLLFWMCSRVTAGSPFRSSCCTL